VGKSLGIVEKVKWGQVRLKNSPDPKVYMGVKEKTCFVEI